MTMKEWRDIMKTREDRETPFYSFVFHPLFTVSFLVMLANDHILRPMNIVPFIAGKISDVAILLFLPAVGALVPVYFRFLLHSASSVLPGRRRHVNYRLRRWDVFFGISATAAMYTLINLSPAFNRMYVSFINGINVLSVIFPRLGSTLDYTDLAVLPVLAVSCTVLLRFAEREVVTPEKELSG